MERNDAKLSGLTHYFTGRPCEHGHISERYTSNGNCIVCAQERERTHAEARKESQARYRARHHGQRKAYFRAYCAQHKRRPTIAHAGRAGLLKKTDFSSFAHSARTTTARVNRRVACRGSTSMLGR